MNVLVLVGSLRADSLNARLARAAAGHLPEGTTTTWSRLGELPFYSEEWDGDRTPLVVADLRRAVAEADALLVATPEYNGSVSGVLKNAVDWLSRPRGSAALAGKPVAVVAASPSPRGAQWAREDLVRILRVAGASPLPRTVGLGSAHTALDDARVTDAEVDAALADLAAELGELRRAA